MSEIKHPDIRVMLSGTDGNIYMILGRVSSALRRAGYASEIDDLTREIFSAESYDKALSICTKWVKVS